MKTPARILIRLLVKGVVFLFMAALLLSLSLPLYVDAGLLLTLLLMFAFTRFSLLEPSLLAASLLVSIVAIEFTARKISLERPPFYREHEKYGDGDRYKRSITDTISMNYGDVVSADSMLPESVQEPRVVHFHSDANGFRNSRDYFGQEFILAGDSFIVGNGSDWPDTLPAILETQLNFPVYSIAYPGDPSEYVAHARWFLDNVSKDVQFAFFFYEGNDFGNGDDSQISDSTSRGSRLLSPGTTKILNGYDKWRGLFLKRSFPWLQYPLFIFNRTRVLERNYLFQRERGGIHMAKVGSKILAAHAFQSSVALVQNRGFGLPPDKAVTDRIACAFFIPTKIRVYYREFGYSMPEPAASFVALQKYFEGTGTATIDFTPVLRAEAQRLLPLGKYVYWRDDSHWNGNGTRAVSQLVVDCLKRKTKRSSYEVALDNSQKIAQKSRDEQNTQ